MTDIEYRDVKRVVNKTAAQLEAGAIILDQFALASDTKQIIARDSSGYYRAMAISKPNTVSGENTFTANQKFNDDVELHFGTTPKLKLTYDITNTICKIWAASGQISISAGVSSTLFLNKDVSNSAVQVNSGSESQASMTWYGKTGANPERSATFFPTSGTDQEAVWSGPAAMYFNTMDVKISTNKSLLFASAGKAYTDGSTVFLEAASATGIKLGNYGAAATATITMSPSGHDVIWFSSQGTTGTINISDGVQVNIGTTNGTLFGTGTSKMGWFGVTPVGQQTNIANADGTLGDITTKFNTLLAQFQALGFQA